MYQAGRLAGHIINAKKLKLCMESWVPADVVIRVSDFVSGNEPKTGN